MHTRAEAASLVGRMPPYTYTPYTPRSRGIWIGVKKMGEMRRRVVRLSSTGVE